MSAEEAAQIEAFAARGGRIVAGFETSLYDENGSSRGDFLLGDLLGIKYLGLDNILGSDSASPRGRHEVFQNYGRVQEKSPLFDGIEDCSLIPVAGDYVRVEPRGQTATPLRLTHPFIVFPEGLSYTTEGDEGSPLAVRGGRVKTAGLFISAGSRIVCTTSWALRKFPLFWLTRSSGP
jgi:hypothetical protein